MTLSNIDFFFFYRNNIRYLLMHKVGYFSNTFSIPFLNKLCLQFSLKKIENLLEREFYNYFFLFKFFFGRRAFLSNYRSFFRLGYWSYEFKIQVIVNSLDSYQVLFFLLNDVFPLISIKGINTKFQSRKYEFFRMIIFKDIDVFSDKKTNLGLFNLKKFLSIKIFCLGVDLFSAKTLFKVLKLEFI